jgi:hypothetical protein
MGLDISAYRGIDKVDCVFDEDGDPIDPVTREYVEYDVRAYVNPDFPGRADGIEDKAIYKATESMGIACGAYSRYNRWRNELAQMAGYPLRSYEQYGHAYQSHAEGAFTATEGPFWELICFSDCDGTIGPIASAKLAKDFAEWAERAKAVGGYFYDQYQQWRAAFEMAADNGMVRFH